MNMVDFLALSTRHTILHKQLLMEKNIISLELRESK